MLMAMPGDPGNRPPRAGESLDGARLVLLLIAAALLIHGYARSQRTAVDEPADRETQPRARRTAACPADNLGALRLHDSRRPGCTATDPGCLDACSKGDASSCYERAVQLELGKTESRSENASLFRRACELGHASGCTNYAASLWVEPADASDLACAQRLFQASCAARDPFGCGMVGRMLVDSGRPADIERGRKVLETSCDELRGFVCRALALELESGSLGAYDPPASSHCSSARVRAGTPMLAGLRRPRRRHSAGLPSLVEL